MTALKDGDTGEQQTIAEELVDRLLWWIGGPHSDPPASIARMPEPERTVVWAQMQDLADRKGEGFMVSLAETLAQQHADHLRNTAGETADPV